MSRVSSGNSPTTISLRRFVLAGLLLATPLVAPAGSLLEFLLGRRDIEVITNTEVTPAGRKLPPPHPAAPQYYIAINGGYQDLGSIVAGITAPPPQEVVKLISAELANRGYLPATEKTPPPTLALFFVWGTLNADDEINVNPDAIPGTGNRAKILRFLGGEKVGFGDSLLDPLTAPATGLTLLSADSRDLLEAATEDFYITVVSAYDFASVVQKKRQLLWMTRIATFGRGFDLPDVLPAMIAIGGAEFGRETSKPVWIRASEKYQPDIKLGELQVVDHSNGAKPPAAESSTAAKKKSGSEPAPATPPKR